MSGDQKNRITPIRPYLSKDLLDLFYGSPPSAQDKTGIKKVHPVHMYFRKDYINRTTYFFVSSKAFVKLKYSNHLFPAPDF